MQRLSIQRDVGGWNLRELKSKDPSWTHLTKKLANGTHSSLSISLCRLEEFIYLFTYWSVPIYIIYLIVTGWHPPRLQKAPRIPSHFRIIFKDRRVDGPVRPSWKFQSWHLEMGRWSKVCKPPPPLHVESWDVWEVSRKTARLVCPPRVGSVFSGCLEIRQMLTTLWGLVTCSHQSISYENDTSKPWEKIQHHSALSQ